ncbi:MAG: allophanate hydrolase [Fluviicoccus sp.]|uniref:allophanate hydrolase n=1 Tax=Fluviicoccus sp. TaxID=2003552 RepID=UPI002728FC0B|nr:allophanate hydrolase [Fluviicoccus sp.]MDO8329814.1 allophanate hydrolase [Fluviicoccus sp.]
MTVTTTAWTLAEWQTAYRQGQTPHALLTALLQTLSPADPAWISLLDTAGLTAALEALHARLDAVNGDLSRLPLYGIPFAVKDNLDATPLPTTCACPSFVYKPEHSAVVVEKLVAAGAVVVGKTNLDQFATGLVGTRSPYGAVPNTFNPAYISGGSSSGSGSVVARGLVPFALGTDTAGSGRVPAGFNNIVGLKPTKGWLSTTGLIPACRTLDCVSVFALTVEDAEAVTAIAAGFDAADPYSRPAPTNKSSFPARPVLGIPAHPQWFGDAQAEAAYQATLAKWQELGVTLKPLDFTPLHATAALLYDGPWVAERYAALESLMEKPPVDLHPVVHDIVLRAKGQTAVDAFKAEYRRAALAREAEQLLAGVDGLLVPTTPGIYTTAAVLAEPVALNSRLGLYTNFVNLLDLCALALPAGFRADGLPAGITLIGRTWQDSLLADLGRQWQQSQPWTAGATGKALPLPTFKKTTTPMTDTLTVAVVGAHLTGMPLNSQLTERGATLLESTVTAPAYRLFALANTTPPKPGLKRVSEGGASIIVELWSMPVEHFGSFVALIPSPLGIGTLELADGRLVKGFICEPWALDDAVDITSFGGWRAYMASRV